MLSVFFGSFLLRWIYFAFTQICYFLYLFLFLTAIVLLWFRHIWMAFGSCCKHVQSQKHSYLNFLAVALHSRAFTTIRSEILITLRRIMWTQKSFSAAYVDVIFVCLSTGCIVLWVFIVSVSFSYCLLSASLMHQQSCAKWKFKQSNAFTCVCVCIQKSAKLDSDKGWSGFTISYDYMHDAFTLNTRQIIEKLLVNTNMKQLECLRNVFLVKDADFFHARNEDVIVKSNDDRNKNN